MMDLSGQVAVVTGSSSGIGEEIALQLSTAGASVVVNSATSVEAGTAVAESLPGPALYVQADISDQAQGRALLEATIAEYGQLDLLVNNAGWTTQVPHDDLDGLTDEIFLKTFDVNVFGTWWLTKSAMPFLKASEHGNVVNVTSVAGLRAIGSSIAYAMTKAALNHMTVLLAKACAPVRVNAIAPGLVVTPWTETWNDMHDLVAATAPAGRSATPEDCALGVMALVTNTYITGEIITIDGGLTL